MTFQPPPPPPPPPPGPPAGGPPAGGPPPGQWGPPPGQGPSGAGGFDPKSVNNLDWGILGAGLLMFIFSFVDWYSYGDKSGFSDVTLDQNAWSGFFGWFGVLCAVLGSVAVGLAIFMPHIKLPMPNRLIGLGLYAIAALCVILSLFIIPDLSVGGVSVDSGKTDTGHDFGFWVSLIVVLAGLVLSLMRAQQTNTAMPGALGKVPKIGK